MKMQSLQKISLNIITENFSNFTSAFIHTKDEVLRKNLLFLHRRYTKEIFRVLIENETLKDEHFHFLLNEHLKEVEINSLLKYSTKENILDHLIPIAQSLHKLKFFGYAHEEDSEHILEGLVPYCSNVEDLSIHKICNDKVLKLISSSCPRLRSLDVAASNITGEGLRSLCSESNGTIVVKCPLRCIDLSATPIKKEDVAFLLEHLPCLEVLEYPKLPSVIEFLCLLNASDKNRLNKLVKLNLQCLDFAAYKDSVEFTRVLYNCTKTCPKIKKVFSNIFKPEDLILVSHFTEIHTLTIQCSDQKKAIDLNEFLILSGKRLKDLTVAGFSLSVSTLVESCPHLESLDLINVTYCKQLHENSTKLLNELHCLTLCKVLLAYNHCRASAMTLLNSSPLLEDLDLRCCKFTNSDIEAELLEFSLKCNLKHLRMHDCDFKVDFLEQFIFNCASIKTLYVSECRNINSGNIYKLKENVKILNRMIQIDIFPQ